MQTNNESCLEEGVSRFFLSMFPLFPEQMLTPMLLSRRWLEACFVSQTIDWVMRIETEFFPVIGAELGSSADTVKHYQKQLDDFIPNVKVFVVFPHQSRQASCKCS